MNQLDLRGLLAALAAGEVYFVVVGGVAVSAHGYVRATEDLDLVPDPAPENVARLVAALSQLDATLPLAAGRRFDPARDAQAVRRGANITMDTSRGAIDIIQRVRGLPPYAALRADAVRAELLGVPVLICSLEHLRAMKEAIGRPRDHADLDELPSSDEA